MKIDIRNNSCKAVLWDLDGTIVDSASYHRLAWNDVFRGHGIDFTDDIYKFTLGRRNNEIIRRYIDPAVSQKEVDIIAEQKEESFRKHIKGNIRPFPFVVEMIWSRTTRKRGWAWSG
ncbi:MAG: HAD family hydrolase [Dehalococcoidales bacterium]